MNCVRWRAFTLAVLLCLIVCMFFAAMWVRSHYRHEDILLPRLEASHRAYAFRTYPGILDLTIIKMTIPVTDRPHWQISVEDENRAKTDGSWDRQNLTLGFGHTQTSFGGRNRLTGQCWSGRQYELFVPFWVLCFAAFIPSICWLTIATRRMKRCKNGYCPQCGYDLRATPNHCPECGMLPPSP